MLGDFRNSGRTGGKELFLRSDHDLPASRGRLDRLNEAPVRCDSPSLACMACTASRASGVDYAGENKKQEGVATGISSRDGNEQSFTEHCGGTRVRGYEGTRVRGYERTNVRGTNETACAHSFFSLFPFPSSSSSPSTSAVDRRGGYTYSTFVRFGRMYNQVAIV